MGTKKRKIHRRCKCGCGRITNLGYKYIRYHHFKNPHSKEHKKKISMSLMGNSNPLGCKRSKETKLKMSLWQIEKCDPNYSYCNIWKDRFYKRDIRKDYCENIDCQNNYKRLGLHHIYLDKKKCAPQDIITLCNPCHVILHHLLQRGFNKPTNLKDYIIINRPGHISYIHKKSRERIKIKRKSYGKQNFSVETDKKNYQKKTTRKNQSLQHRVQTK